MRWVSSRFELAKRFADLPWGVYYALAVAPVTVSPALLPALLPLLPAVYLDKHKIGNGGNSGNSRMH